MDAIEAKDAAAPEAASENTTAPVYKRLLAMVRVIRTHRGISVPEAFQRFGGPGIEAEYRKCVEEMRSELSAEA